MDGRTILQQSEKATFEVVEGETILVHMENGAYYTLNKVGTEFWQMLDGRTNLADHAARTADQYGVAVGQVVADFISMGERLQAEELVRVVPGR